MRGRRNILRAYLRASSQAVWPASDLRSSGSEDSVLPQMGDHAASCSPYSLRTARSAGGERKPVWDEIQLKARLSRSSASESWGRRMLVAVVDYCLEIAIWLDMLLHPIAILCELLHEPSFVAEPPLESISILAASLFDDHACCLALLTKDATQPISAAQQAELVAYHERMAWVLRTYLA